MRHLLLEIGNVVIAKMKALEQPELLLEPGVNGEFSAKRIFAEEKVEDSLLPVHAGLPISISHGDLVEISQHRIYQFVGGFHLSGLLFYNEFCFATCEQLLPCSSLRSFLWMTSNF